MVVDPKIDAMFPGLEEGNILVAGVRKLALPHQQTAELVKSFGSGVGRRGQLHVDGEFAKYSFEKGRIVWTFRVDDSELVLD
jgi:hypothetical protein